MASLTYFLLPLLALASPVKRQGSAPPSSEITILSASTSGNGCPQGTVSTTMSPDSTLVTFGFDSFQAYIGPGTSVADHSKNCQIHLSIQYPGGFQYSLLDATYHGYAQLDAGVTGTFYSTYYFSEAAEKTTTTTSSISGSAWAAGDVYTKDDQIPTASTIWSPCGEVGILNVNNRIALTSNSTTASGQLSDDDATVAFTQQLHVSWQPCTASSTGDTSGSSFVIPSGVSSVTSG